jgi:hypothetical protein
LRNLPEFFRRNLDRNPVVKKSSEFNGADRKSTESIGSVAGNERKQPVPTVGTVDLGLFLESLFALYRDNITSEQDKLIIAAHWALLRSGYSSMSNGKVGKTFSILYFIQ